MHLTRKRILSTGIVLSVLLIGGSAWAVLRGSSSDIDSARLATVERGDVAKSVVATRRIEPISKVEIKSKANGIVKEIKVEVGDRVTVGQVLAELDKDNLSARLRESRAALVWSHSRNEILDEIRRVAREPLSADGDPRNMWMQWVKMGSS